jgi:hypothetical protein
MIVASAKGRLVRYFLIALIIGFFIIPVITVCFFDCKVSYTPKRIASALLIFFR